MSESEGTSPFQMKGERAILELLERERRPIPRREVLTGIVPFYSTEPQTAVKLVSPDFVVWLHDNEMGFRAGNLEEGFELNDFSTEQELLDAFIARFQLALRAS